MIISKKDAMALAYHFIFRAVSGGSIRRATFSYLLLVGRVRSALPFRVKQVRPSHGGIASVVTVLGTAFPQPHVFHLFTAFALQRLADKRRALFVATMLSVRFSGETVSSKMLFCQ